MLYRKFNFVIDNNYKTPLLEISSIKYCFNETDNCNHSKTSLDASLKFILPWDEFTFVRAYISIIFAIIHKECKEILIAEKIYV